MNNRICICCGEPMTEAERGSWKDNPNVCFACSSFLEEPSETLPPEQPAERRVEMEACEEDVEGRMKAQQS